MAFTTPADFQRITTHFDNDGGVLFLDGRVMDTCPDWQDDGNNDRRDRLFAHRDALMEWIQDGLGE